MTDEGNLVVYCRTWCPDCARARRWLDEHNVSYTLVDVDNDPDARERAAGFNDGQLHTPTFEHKGETCVDFKPDRLREIIGLVD
jgi:glutaredoxin